MLCHRHSLLVQGVLCPPETKLNQSQAQQEDKTAMTLSQNKEVPAPLSWPIPTRQNLVIL